MMHAAHHLRAVVVVTVCMAVFGGGGWPARAVFPSFGHVCDMDVVDGGGDLCYNDMLCDGVLHRTAMPLHRSSSALECSLGFTPCTVGYVWCVNVHLHSWTGTPGQRSLWTPGMATTPGRATRHAEYPRMSDELLGCT